MARIYKSANSENAGAGGGSATPFVQSFDSGASWGAASGGYYSIFIPQSTHGKSANPTITVYEDLAGQFEEVILDEVSINASGDVTLKVTENIDTRFAGKVVIL